MNSTFGLNKQVKNPPYVDNEKCHVCRRCAAMKNCRGGAFIRFEKSEPPYIDVSRCQGCFTCLEACKHGAVFRMGDVP